MRPQQVLPLSVLVKGSLLQRQLSNSLHPTCPKCHLNWDLEYYFDKLVRRFWQ